MLLVMSLASACNGNDERIVAASGSGEQKPERTLLPDSFKSIGPLKSSGSEDAVDLRLAAAVDYDLYVYSNSSNRRICMGTAMINIMSDFSIIFPQGIIKCSSLKIDMARILGSATTRTAEEKAKEVRTHDNKVMYVSYLMGANFTPPRPLMIGPIITRPEDFLNFSPPPTDTSMTGVSAATGKQYAGTGSFAIRVNEVKGRYTNKVVGETFNDIIRWEIGASGFEGVPKSLGMLFTKMEWWYNIKPIMIPKIAITGKMDDFIERTTPGDGSDDMVGEIRIELEVNNYNIK
jgi:hypothetical protein